jgi:nucleotide-binding universal stress UspA family protein
MKKVLIALDYAPTAQKVAETGFSLAKTLGAEIMLLHVMADVTYYSVIEHAQIMGAMGFNKTELAHLFDGGLKKAMKQFLERSKQQLGDENIQTLVKEGEFAESIKKAGKDFHADFIVMGTHSRNWVDSIILGSVTKKVLSHTSIPLFIVPIKKNQ